MNIKRTLLVTATVLLSGVIATGIYAGFGGEPGGGGFNGGPDYDKVFLIQCIHNGTVSREFIQINGVNQGPSCAEYSGFGDTALNGLNLFDKAKAVAHHSDSLAAHGRMHVMIVPDDPHCVFGKKKLPL